MEYGNVEGIEKPASRVVMGTMIGVMGRDVPKIDRDTLLDHYLERGGNCFDTAYVYKTEAVFGEAVAERGVREKIVLIGKGAHTPHCTPEGLTRELFESLDNMKTDYVDLYFMHRDNLDVPVGEFVSCLNDHLRAGRIRAFGGSNWTTRRIEDACDYAAANGLVGFSASSPNLSLAVWNRPRWEGCLSASDPGSRAWYGQRGTPVFAWSSQSGGFFTDRFDPESASDPNLSEALAIWVNEGSLERRRRACRLAKEKGVTPNQVALAYVFSQPFPTFALIGPETIAETEESIAALDLKLSETERAWLNLEADSSPPWRQ